MNDFILLQDSSKSDCQDLLIFDKKLSKKDFERIDFLVSYTRNYAGFWMDAIIEAIKEEYQFKWIELTGDRIKTIKY